MRRITKIAASIALFAFAVSACVPARQVEELKEKQTKCEEERRSLLAEKQQLETENKEFTANNEQLKKQVKLMAEDTTNLSNSLGRMTRQYDKINKLNDEILAKLNTLQAGSAEENRKLMLELQSSQEELQRKEDNLKLLEAELDAKRQNLDKVNGELVKREKRVKELEDALAAKDAAARALRDKLAEALLGFKDKGLTVEQRNGKIYISLESKLLFATGSTEVGADGKKALGELAKVLGTQPDISILVEGHTDTDKIAPGGKIKDNWELSTARATEVVRILLENKGIKPINITAAGRGEFAPLDPADTPEAKAKNRRIEIILTPDLDKLFEIIEGSK